MPTAKLALGWLTQYKPMSEEAFLDRITPAGKRAKMARALQKNRTHGLPKRTYYNAFVKQELTNKPVRDMLNGNPRLIQAPDDRTKVALGLHTVPMSKALAQAWAIGNDLCYASGCTPMDLGMWFALTLDELGADCHFLETDFHRWDAHLSQEANDFEADIYEQFFHCPKQVVDLFRRQRASRGVTAHNIKYEVNGTRKSGDPNTSMGNSLLNGIAHYAILAELYGRGNFRLIVLGDDMLCGIRWTTYISSPLSSYRRYHEWFEALGLIAESTIQNKHTASFCSQYFYRVHLSDRMMESFLSRHPGAYWALSLDHYVLAPKPGRFLSKYGYAIGHPTKMDEARLRGVTLSLLPHAMAVPFIRPYLRMGLGTGAAVDPGWKNTDIEGEWEALPNDVIPHPEEDIANAYRYDVMFRADSYSDVMSDSARQRDAYVAMLLRCESHTGMTF
jgi:hypothetical protein